MSSRIWAIGSVTIVASVAIAAMVLLALPLYPPQRVHAATSLADLIANGFTGDAAVDFNFTDNLKFTASDPVGDVGIPIPPLPAGTVSGWDISAMHVAYDAANDTLFVGFDCSGICGDADGDGDAGGTGGPLTGLGGVDNASLGDQEAFAFLLDVDADSAPGALDFELIVGVRRGLDITSFGMYVFNGDPADPGDPAGWQAALNPGQFVVTLFADPSAGQPDIEFTITNFSQIPDLQVNANGVIRFNTSFFQGSGQDDGIGEEVLPAPGEFEPLPLGAINLEKSTDDAGGTPQDADTATGPTLTPGSQVTWTYVVRNDESAALSNLVIVDDNGTPLDATDDVTVVTGETLAANQTKTFTATGIAQTPQYANIAVVTADWTDGQNKVQTVTDSDPSHYIGSGTSTPTPTPTTPPTPTPPPGPILLPAIDVEKATNGRDADAPPGPLLAPGDDVTWSYVVRNVGETRLINVVLRDDNGTPANPADDIVIVSGVTLEVGEVQTFSRTGTARVGQYANVARVVGASSETPFGDVFDTDPSHYVAPLLEPDIDLEKATNGVDADQPPGVRAIVGGPIVWTYVMTNTGNVPLTNVTMIDDNGTPADPSDDFTVVAGDTLAVGQTKEFAVQLRGGAVSGAFGNFAVVTTAEGVTDRDPSHYTASRTPVSDQAAVDLEKATNGVDADDPPGPLVGFGSTITWTFVVTNTGSSDLTGVTIVDDNGTPDDPSDDVIVAENERLQVGESKTFTRQGTAKAGQYANRAVVTTTEGVTDSDPSHYIAITLPDSGSAGLAALVAARRPLSGALGRDPWGALTVLMGLAATGTLIAP